MVPRGNRIIVVFLPFYSYGVTIIFAFLSVTRCPRESYPYDRSVRQQISPLALLSGIKRPLINLSHFILIGTPSCTFISTKYVGYLTSGQVRKRLLPVLIHNFTSTARKLRPLRFQFIHHAQTLPAVDTIPESNHRYLFICIPSFLVLSFLTVPF